MTKELIYSERETNYWDFVNSGKLSTLRRAFSSTFQEIVRTILASNSPGFNRELKFYLAQLYHDELCTTKIINQLITEPFVAGNFKVVLPTKIYNGLVKEIPTWNLNRNVGAFFFWQTKKSFRVAYKILKTFFILVIKARSSKVIRKPNTVFIIGHTKELIVQNSEKEPQESHNYSLWRKTNGYKKTDVVFLSDLDFFSCVLKENSYLENLKLTLKVVYLFPITVLKHKLKMSDLMLTSEQILFYLIVKKSKPSSFRLEIAFTESSGSKRPLWTYELERLGGAVNMNFFSNSAVLRVENEQGCSAETKLYTWTNYDVVSTWQQNVIKEYSVFGSESKFRKFGVPWFQDINYRFARSEKYSVAVFDIEPQLGYFGSSSLNDWGLSSVTYSLEFIDSILKICAKYDVLFMHKRKRELPSKKVHPQYARRLDFLSKQSIYISIPPTVAPSRLIQKVSGVISYVPTTTEILARQMNVPSIFFDPSGLIDKSEPALIESKVLSSQEELEKWIIEIKKTKAHV